MNMPARGAYNWNDALPASAGPIERVLYEVKKTIVG